MIYVVSSENRRSFHHLVNEMHRQRKAVFIDQLRWSLEEIAGQEIDDYDSEDVIYPRRVMDRRSAAMAGPTLFEVVLGLIVPSAFVLHRALAWNLRNGSTKLVSVLPEPFNVVLRQTASFGDCAPN